MTPVLLTAEQVAERLQVPITFVYRRASSWPFTRKLSHKVVRFDAEELEAWIAKTRPRHGAK